MITLTDKIDIPVQKDRLYNDIMVLTSVDPWRNYRNITSLNYIADHIFEVLGQLNFTMEWQPYYIDGVEYKNIIARYGDCSKERVVIGAHYDVCDEQPGADDNASAVAGLLEVGRLLNQLKPELEYGIELVAYTLEEPPFFATQNMGSAVHASSLARNNIKVKAMICLEMIGYFSSEPNSQRFPVGFLKYIYPSVGNFITVVGRLGELGFLRKFARRMKESSNIDIRVFAAPASIRAISLSDHRNYWSNGFRALMICNTSFYRNKNYHQKTDTIDTLNFDKMREVVKGVYWAMVNL